MLVHPSPHCPLKRVQALRSPSRSGSCINRRRSALRAAHSDQFEASLLTQQERLIQETERLDGAGTFKVDRWERNATDPNAGYGITAVLEGGSLLEKAAVNISIVGGQLSPERAKAMSSRGRSIDAAGGQHYSAAALSLVYHPAHPFVPTLRADVRRFQLFSGGSPSERKEKDMLALDNIAVALRHVGSACWYGGGCDLTPAYLFGDDSTEFHAYWKNMCDKHGTDLYPRFKSWCDEYFYIPARKEHRGIGGIFFDDVVGGGEGEPADAQAFVEDVAAGILVSWRPIAERRRQMQFSGRHRDWQLLRRGRYLEFNLLYDRGVKFGLGGRIESVMVSAPPLIAWRYNVVPEKGSSEEQLVDILQKPKAWV